MLNKSIIKANNMLKYGTLLLIALIFLFMLPGQLLAAGSVTLQWDENETAPEGYRLFQREEGQSYDDTNWVYQGKGVIHTVDNLEAGVTYYFVTRAFNGDTQSDNSNEVRYDTPDDPSHTINATAGAGGSISPQGNVSVEDGQNRSFTISASSGYQISDVQVDGVSKGAQTQYNFNNITTNHTIAASFSKIPPQHHSINATAGTGGSISPQGNVSVEDGQDRSFTISASSGYQISDVLVDGASQGVRSSYTFNSVAANHTIEAIFSAISSDQSPLADAGPTQQVTSSAHVTLDGSGCSDPNGAELRYQWTQKAGPGVNLTDRYSKRPEFTAPEIIEGSIQLRFELTVINDKQLTASDTCLVQVTAIKKDPIDTDGDGTPDKQDSDDDNDGMPDRWENKYGFDPLDKLDAALDADHDGMTNLNEYQNGTNPLVADENQPPDQPTVTYPENGDTEVGLTPTLQSTRFRDPDKKDSHTSSQWRIQTADDQEVVFDITSGRGILNQIEVPLHILNPNTRYIVKVRYYDNHDLASKWSQALAFTTQTDSNDQNNNGIPDDQDVDEDTDLNKDNIPDRDQENRLKRFKRYVHKRLENIFIKRFMGVSIESSDTVTSIEAAATINPFDLDSTMPPQSNPDQEMPYGMISYKIKVSEPGQSARVQLFFSDPIDSQTTWLHFDSATGWDDCSDQVHMDASGYRAERELVDGGPGDADGIANGTIVDIIGPQANAEDGDSLSLSDGNSSSSTESSSCFIQSLF